MTSRLISSVRELSEILFLMVANAFSNSLLAVHNFILSIISRTGFRATLATSIALDSFFRFSVACWANFPISTSFPRFRIYTLARTAAVLEWFVFVSSLIWVLIFSRNTFCWSWNSLSNLVTSSSCPNLSFSIFVSICAIWVSFLLIFSLMRLNSLSAPSFPAFEIWPTLPKPSIPPTALPTPSPVAASLIFFSIAGNWASRPIFSVKRSALSFFRLSIDLLYLSWTSSARMNWSPGSISMITESTKTFW